MTAPLAHVITDLVYARTQRLRCAPALRRRAVRCWRQVYEEAAVETAQHAKEHALMEYRRHQHYDTVPHYICCGILFPDVEEATAHRWWVHGQRQEEAARLLHSVKGDKNSPTAGGMPWLTTAP